MTDDVTKTPSAQRLKSFFDRIERLQEDRKAVTDDIREVFSEAKGAGFDTKVMRQVLRLKKLSKAERQETQSLVEVYSNAVGL